MFEMEGSNYRLTYHQQTCLQDLIKIQGCQRRAGRTRMLPYGTPDTTGAQSDWQPSITTR